MARDTVIYNPGTANVWKVIATNDANHRVTGLNYGPVALDPMDITFFYDSVGRLRNRTSPKSGFTRRVFSYDSLGALVNACDSTGAQCQNVVNGGTSGNAWAYDSAGNRIAQAGLSNITYGPGNRIQSYGTTSYTYYNDGSTMSSTLVTGMSTTVKNYGWDAAGRLREIRNGSGGLIDSMYYDARGRRVIKKMAAASEYYVYEGAQVVLDVDGSGTVLREYAWNPGAIDHLLGVRTVSPADTFVAILDPRIGTVRGLVRFRTGTTLVKRYGEAPWGETAPDTGLAVRYRFAGRERDAESGLYYMRARYYDPSLGRWVSEDPIGIAGGPNLFAYSGNDPINSSDPSGLGPFGPPPPGYHCVTVIRETGGGFRYCSPDEGYGDHGGSLPGDFFSGRPGYPGTSPGGEPGLGPTKGGGAVNRPSGSDPGEEAVRRCKAAIYSATVSVVVDVSGFSLVKTAAKGIKVAFRAGQFIDRAVVQEALSTGVSQMRLANRLSYESMAAGAVSGAAMNELTGSDPLAGALTGAIPVLGSLYSIAQAGGACFYPH